jgi:hypothetical protein
LHVDLAMNRHVPNIIAATRVAVGAFGRALRKRGSGGSAAPRPLS